MQIIRKPKKFNALIPPIPCSEEMRQQIDVIATSQEVSLAEVVRFAINRLLEEWEHLVAEGTSPPQQHSQ